MRLRSITNEYGTPVAEYRCNTCGGLFTVCPSPAANQDDQWENCLSDECESYDPERDVDKWFSEGRVREIPIGNGKSRLVPIRVIDGGKPDD